MTIEEKRRLLTRLEIRAVKFVNLYHHYYIDRGFDLLSHLKITLHVANIAKKIRIIQATKTI